MCPPCVWCWVWVWPLCSWDAKDLEERERRRRELYQENEALRRKHPRRSHGKVRTGEQQEVDVKISTLESQNESCRRRLEECQVAVAELNKEIKQFTAVVKASVPQLAKVSLWAVPCSRCLPPGRATLR